MKFYLLKETSWGYGNALKPKYPYKENHIAYGEFYTVKFYADNYPNDWIVVNFKYGK